MKDWRKACARLWGDDWMAPLSEVLKISRRTVERWNAESHQIPERVRRDIVDLVNDAEAALTKHDTTMRAYGTVLRRIARGESPSDVRAWIEHYHDALDHAVKVRGRYTAIGDFKEDET